MARWEPDAAQRLMSAAVTLFDTQGYDTTTVNEITAAAGLTKRTFFRHFADKREVLFTGSAELQQAWLLAVVNAPAAAGAVAALAEGFDVVAARFDGLHTAARERDRIIRANAELRERELSKLDDLAEALAGALRRRGVDDRQAVLAARIVTTVFQTAFAEWVGRKRGSATALRRLLDSTLAGLRDTLEDSRTD